MELIEPSILEIKLFISELDYQDEWFPVDPGYLMSNLIGKGLFIRGIKKDSKVSAIGISQISRPFLHSKLKSLNLIYYQSLLKGYSAVKSLELYHYAMLKYALDNRIPFCTSSSIDNNHEIFLRVLRKNGWTLRGRTAVYRVLPQEATRLVTGKPLEG